MSVLRGKADVIYFPDVVFILFCQTGRFRMKFFGSSFYIFILIGLIGPIRVKIRPGFRAVFHPDWQFRIKRMKGNGQFCLKMSEIFTRIGREINLG